jgi:DNA-binding IclR family transcriptional regulator
MPDVPTPARAGTLESGLDVLEHLIADPRGLGVTELAAELNLDKGNLHRLLKVLITRGYVEQDAQSRRYRATAEIIHLAGSLLRQLDLRSAGEEICNDLLVRTGESTHLAQATRDGLVYILQRRPPSRVSVETEVGSRPPMHCTATGKAALAFSTPDELALRLPDSYEVFTYRTHATAEALERDLERTRARGYAIDDEEYNAGARCVAAPVFGMEGQLVGCIGVSTPTQRVALDQLDALATEVVDAARSITRALGGPDRPDRPTISDSDQKEDTP